MAQDGDRWRAPVLTTRAEYEEAKADTEVWLDGAAGICRQLGIDPGGRGLVRTTRFPVVLLPSGYVVKFYGPWDGGPQKMAAELTGLGIAARDPELPIPRVVATGDLADQWSYLVTSAIRGVRFSDVEDSVSVADRQELARWLGGFLSRLHAIPLEERERDDGWYDFEAMVEQKYWKMEWLLAHFGALPASMLEQVPAWLPPISELLTSAEVAVFTHGDLHGDNVMGELKSGRFEPTGVIDFNGARVGHPMWDIGVTWRYILATDRGLLSTFASAAGLPGRGQDSFPKAALTWSMLQAPFCLEGVVKPGSTMSLDDLAEQGFGTGPG